MRNKVFQELFGSWNKELLDIIDYQKLMSFKLILSFILENSNLHKFILKNTLF